MRHLVVICAAGLLLSGCAQKLWTKQGFTMAEFNRDNYACERDSRQSGYYGGGLAGMIEMQSFFNRCMTAQGYYQVDSK